MYCQEERGSLRYVLVGGCLSVLKIVSEFSFVCVSRAEWWLRFMAGWRACVANGGGAALGVFAIIGQFEELFGFGAQL